MSNQVVSNISQTLIDSPLTYVFIGVIFLLIISIKPVAAAPSSTLPTAKIKLATVTSPNREVVIDPLTTFFSNILNQLISPDFHYAFLSLFVILFSFAFIYVLAHCFFKSFLLKLFSRRGSIGVPLLSNRDTSTDVIEIREIHNNNSVQTEQPPVAATIIEAPVNPPVRLARRIFQRIAIRRPARRQN